MKKKSTIGYAILIFLSACSLAGPAAEAQTIPAEAQTGEKDIPYYISHAPFAMPVITAPVIPDRRFNVLDYGAVGDGAASAGQAPGVREQVRCWAGSRDRARVRRCWRM